MAEPMGKDARGVLARVRGFALPAVGFSFLWPLLHASPYYPLALSRAFMEQGAGGVSAYHVVYSTELVLFLLGAFALFRVLSGPSVPARPLVVLSALAGLAGGLLMMGSGAPDGPGAVPAGISLTLIALCVSLLIVLWFARMTLLALEDIVLAVVFSYAVSSAVWVLLQAVLPGAVPAFVCVCPVASAVLLLVPAGFSQVGADTQLGNLSSLHWGVIVFCLALSYVGAVCVRVITSMEVGGTPIGDMASERGLITAACSLVIALAGFAFCLKARYRVSFLITVVAFLALVAIGALVIVTLSNSQGAPALVGKRIFISALHCVDVLLAAILMRSVVRHRLSVVAVAALFGVFVCAIPQFISFDLLYQTGALARMESLSFIVPMAAVVSFAITVVVVGGLVAYVVNVSRDANEQSENWERDLCARATASVALTKRELEVVELTYRGYTARSIAKELLVSESTVKAHLAHAYRKMDVHTKQALIEYIDSYRGLA